MIKCQLKSKVLNLCSEGCLPSVVWEAEPYLPTLGCEKEGDRLFNLNEIGGKYQSGAQQEEGLKISRLWRGDTGAEPDLLEE